MSEGQGTYLGRYRLGEVLGRGAMGVVYEGYDPKLKGRKVAIKTILKSQLLDPQMAAEYSARFDTEAGNVASLNHPNIVTVYDFGNEADVAYLVMEFIDGKELKHYLDAKHLFGIDETVGIVCNLLDALDYAHEKFIYHRDIKPANVMIDVRGRVKLTDFGVARQSDGSGNDGTRAGTMVGTPSYMSPEQIKGLPAQAAADLFATGVVLYQCLTLHKPFSGGSEWEIWQKIVNEPPPPLSQYRAGVPPALERAMLRALAKDPKERPPSAAAMIADLKASIAGASFDPDATRIVSRPAPGPARDDSSMRPVTQVGVGTGSQGGGSAAAAPAFTQQSSEIELEFWRSIKDSGDREEFQLFLERFPAGTYSDLARRKMSKLGGAVVADDTDASMARQIEEQEAKVRQMRADQERRLAEAERERELARQRAEEARLEQIRAEEARRREEEEARLRAEAAARARAEEEARLAEQARLQALEAERIAAAQREAARVKAEEEARAKAAEEAAARARAAEEEAKRIAASEAEARRVEAARIKAAEEEAARVKAAEEAAARIKAEEEAARIKAAEEQAARVAAAQEEAARIKAAEEKAARVKAEEEAARIKAEEEARIKAAKEEAARVKAAQEEAARAKAEQEEAVRVKAAEEEAASRAKAAEETARQLKLKQKADAERREREAADQEDATRLHKPGDARLAGEQWAAAEKRAAEQKAQEEAQQRRETQVAETAPSADETTRIIRPSDRAGLIAIAPESDKEKTATPAAEAQAEAVEREQPSIASAIGHEVKEAAAARAMPAPQRAPAPNKTPLFLGIGAAVLVLAGGAYMLTSKKEAPVEAKSVPAQPERAVVAEPKSAEPAGPARVVTSPQPAPEVSNATPPPAPDLRAEKEAAKRAEAQRLADLKAKEQKDQKALKEQKDKEQKDKEQKELAARKAADDAKLAEENKAKEAAAQKARDEAAKVAAARDEAAKKDLAAKAKAKELADQKARDDAAAAQRAKELAEQKARDEEKAKATAAAAAAKAKANSDPDALFAQAQSAEKEGRSREAVDLYKRAYGAGSGRAARMLGDIYGKGSGDVGRDYGEQLQWYEKAKAAGVDVPTPGKRKY
ncbi:protein kinase [Massilia sp. R2A-15]|uniref:serine/threonine protein kinase n=1 Tax=Massilia sp. R2A-15 TaxID=3064278 RepID=UPI0027328E19|nr:serine/threonine protein kinase [Massilia sp. R2A-15]WLI89476.1 protein kinase [Massilia sp. R2A-15]